MARQFQLGSEVHNVAISNPDNAQYLILNNWNTQSIEIFGLKGLLESSSDAISDGQLAKVDIEDFAPFSALDVDQVHVFTLCGFSYLIVTLSNGYVLCFNLYTNALAKTTSSDQLTDSAKL